VVRIRESVDDEHPVRIAIPSRFTTTERPGDYDGYIRIARPVEKVLREVDLPAQMDDAGVLSRPPLRLYSDCAQGTDTPINQATDAATEFVTSLFIESREELVRFLAFRVRDRVLIDDLEQEVYLRLLRLDQVHLIRNPRAYVMRVAANVVADYGRRSGGKTTEEAATEALVEDGSGPFEQFVWRERFERVQRAVSALPDRCRRALLLHRRNGLTYDEIAVELGVSRSMVKKYLKKALLLCRQAIGDDKEYEDMMENWR
jgi:RNA polymerase sigma-19 factor, ECF subfamily